MSKLRRVALLAVPTIAVGMAGSLLVMPAGADAPSDPAKDYEAEAIEMKLERAAEISPDQDFQFGTEPYQHVTDAAGDAVDGAACSISQDAAVALTIAPTWPEVAPSGEPPSPMTLSRYDTQPSLGDPEGRAEGLWFHPGIGMWQMDSAGLGNDYTAADAIDTQYTADRMAPFMVDKYCDAINGGSSEASARASAWTDWNACSDGACETAYNAVLGGVTTVDGVGQHGGAEPRDCEYDGVALDCLFVDPANAQGDDWWTNPGSGGSPIAAPFYVFRLGDSDVTEARYWFAEDSGAGEDVEATRPFGSNARDSLTWQTGSGFCDVTEGRGDC